MSRRFGFARMGAAWADALYPPGCLLCQAPLSDARALCVDCWGGMHLTEGTACDGCGTPMLLAIRGDLIRCDFCLSGGSSWNRGRAAATYGGGARALILALKHGDRPDIARTIARWMQRAGADTLAQTDILVPIPLHWRRFLSRRYNQSAEISRHLSLMTGVAHSPGVLRRVRATPPQRASVVMRAQNVRHAFRVPQHMHAGVKGSRVTLVDDVLTTGATLNAATEALLAAGAAKVDILVFARVVQADEQTD